VVVAVVVVVAVECGRTFVGRVEGTVAVLETEVGTEVVVVVGATAAVSVGVAVSVITTCGWLVAV
jgi:hypothetical protein